MEIKAIWWFLNLFMRYTTTPPHYTSLFQRNIIHEWNTFLCGCLCYCDFFVSQWNCSGSQILRSTIAKLCTDTAPCVCAPSNDFDVFFCCFSRIFANSRFFLCALLTRCEIRQGLLELKFGNDELLLFHSRAEHKSMRNYLRLTYTQNTDSLRWDGQSNGKLVRFSFRSVQTEIGWHLIIACTRETVKRSSIQLCAECAHAQGVHAKRKIASQEF